MQPPALSASSASNARSVAETNFISATILHSQLTDDGERLSVRRTTCDALPDVEMGYGGIDAHLARLYLQPTPACTMQQGRRMLQLEPRAPMECSFRDMRDPCVWRIVHPVDIISFELPRGAMAHWARDVGLRGFHGLDYESGLTMIDDVITHFGLALMAPLATPGRAPALFVDYILNAFCTYLVRIMGRELPDGWRRGGLALWQERRAKEMMEADLRAPVTLKQLADACGLSAAHFARAFRQSVGEPPHRWLTGRRVELAKALLTAGELPLADIALRCGFSDQSHFTQVFSRLCGQSPGVWRRAHQRNVVPGRRPE
ncbi:helix-turn-helix transcriptional regulator [Nitrospirillum viridazoti]|uniref:HTH araC/xylS-type domain-containing protein n=1 Tax=Nitrospirillum viridazoti CBAmc TaxID=1441467 RepID=A0A248K280_9PROT|nr:AraC family transcriptional regulator [Nitrospirillum amazonense]ASG24538.1 hypothetical protein Y958_27110 [Nitrospirillum amazonense CBAmc]TWB37109.1 AraC-like DNA-binding protein [Nitrospirillum amazonense]